MPARGNRPYGSYMQTTILILPLKITTMQTDISAYHRALPPTEKKICDLLYRLLAEALPEAEHKIWHGHPVWFLDGNPVAGYNTVKAGLRLFFWSGQSFDEPGLTPSGTFKAAECIYTDPGQVNEAQVAVWLAKAREIQWDYKNIVKRKGQLERLK